MSSVTTTDDGGHVPFLFSPRGDNDDAATSTAASSYNNHNYNNNTEHLQGTTPEGAAMTTDDDHDLMHEEDDESSGQKKRDDLISRVMNGSFQSGPTTAAATNSRLRSESTASRGSHHYYNHGEEVGDDDDPLRRRDSTMSSESSSSMNNNNNGVFSKLKVLFPSPVPTATTSAAPSSGQPSPTGGDTRAPDKEVQIAEDLRLMTIDLKCSNTNINGATAALNAYVVHNAVYRRALVAKKTPARAAALIRRYSALIDATGIATVYFQDVAPALRYGIVYFDPSLPNTVCVCPAKCPEEEALLSNEELVRAVVFVLEIMARHFRSAATQPVDVIVDMHGITWRSLRTARLRVVLDALCDAYPTRLGTVALHNCEGILTGFLVSTLMPQLLAGGQRRKIRQRVVVVKGDKGAGKVWGGLPPTWRMPSYLEWETHLRKVYPWMFLNDAPQQMGVGGGSSYSFATSATPSTSYGPPRYALARETLQV
eukprot:PhM_4_TR17244/c0_g1_i1/m.52855